ncbi:MAG: lipase family alpha/beta hydrolase, partial [Acidimicrobiia bacterium]
YNPVRRGIPEIAEQVSCKVDEILEKCGTREIHIIGHSLGGLVARYYIEQMGGFRKVRTLITLGTPHRGTIAAYFSRSQAAKQMRPGSELLRMMNAKRRPRSVSYISYYSDLDALVVPAKSAKLSGGPNVRNVLVHDLGHMSLLISNGLIASIATNLTSYLDVGHSVNGGKKIEELFG